mgnify:CR=1 FL=1
MKNYFIYVCLFSLFFASCGDKENDLGWNNNEDENEIVIASSKTHPGLGDSDDLPMGAALTLPEGIRIVKRPHHPFNPALSKLFAHVNAFYVDVNFVNDRMPGTAPVIVEFPAGVIGVSMDHDKQNGVSIEKYLIAVPPTERIGGGRDTTTVYVGMACINASKSMPWYDNNEVERHYPISRNNYEQFIVTSDPNLLKLLEVLKGHPKLKVTQHWDPVEANEYGYVVPEWLKIYHHIQDHIWAVTDGRRAYQKGCGRFATEITPL